MMKNKYESMLMVKPMWWVFTVLFFHRCCMTEIFMIQAKCWAWVTTLRMKEEDAPRIHLFTEATIKLGKTVRINSLRTQESKLKNNIQ